MDKARVFRFDKWVAILETKRIRLRRLRLDDFDHMQMLESDPLVMKFTPSRIPQSEAQTQKRLENQISKQKEFEPFGIWAVEFKSGSSFLGWCMLMPQGSAQLELGFMLVQAYWGQGFASEICQQLLKYAGSYPHISALIAKTNLDNQASMHILIKMGFTLKEVVSVPENVFGGHIDLNLFELNLKS